MLRRPHSSRSSRRAARDGWRGGCQGFGRFLGGRCAQRHLCLLLCRREASLTPPRVLFAWPVSHTRVFCLHGQSHTHTRVCLFRILAPPHFFPHIQSHQCIVIFIFWHYDSHYSPPPSSSRLRLDEIGVRYADTEPEYLFHIKGDDYIDGNCSTHYSRYFNHAEDGRLDPSIPPPLPHPTLHPSPCPRRPTPPPTPHRPTPPSPPHPTACA